MHEFTLTENELKTLCIKNRKNAYLLIVTVGNNKHPATNRDIETVKELLMEAVKEDRPLITSHIVKIKKIKI